MVMAEEEKEIWSEKASMLDFAVNPFQWIFTLVTLGVYFVLVYLIRLNTRYTLTNERLKITKGLLSKSVDEIELFRIKDTKVQQTFLNRIVGIGQIDVISSDLTGSFRLKYLPKAPDRREEIRRLSNESRERQGVRTIVNE
jgi:uncharacterized membrane protein YdbT with pleckstrin-like domain